MKLIALCPVRADAWSFAASARAVLKWCDGLIVCQNAGWADKATTDAIPTDPRVTHMLSDAPAWDEADIRRAMLEKGRELGGTHFALVDADELLTGNLIGTIRDTAAALNPGDCLRLPWLHLWRGLDQYRDDESPFGRQAYTSVVFRDAPHLTYRPRDDGYQFHMRAPAGARIVQRQDRSGGLMHMQHVVWRRVCAKQAMMRVTERLRWKTLKPCQINARYGPTTDEAGITLRDVPGEWWTGNEDVRALIDLDAEPWQEQEVARLIGEHGRERFEGLDLLGL